MSGVVIIGAGHGGFQAAQSLRQQHYPGKITLIGDEPGLPYQRPPLSKAYMKEGNEERLLFKPKSFFEKNDIDYRANVRATAFDCDRQIVKLEGGTELSYEHLILATGASNRRLPMPGGELGGIYELRDLSDAQLLRSKINDVSHAIVIGGGFIGLEFAAVARSFGIDVTIIEAAPRVMARAVSEPVSNHFHDLHRSWGAKLLLNSMVTKILSDDGQNAIGVELASGEEIKGDLILLAIGVIPNADLAENAGLECNNGIVVDLSMRASKPNVFAIGDSANYTPVGQKAPMRLESVQNATDGARTVASIICGMPAELDAVAWFWSDQADAKLQIAGLTHTADHLEPIDRGEGRLAVFCFENDKFIGVETVNSPGDHMAARKVLAMSQDFTRTQLEQADFDLKALLKAGQS